MLFYCNPMRYAGMHPTDVGSVCGVVLFCVTNDHYHTNPKSVALTWNTERRYRSPVKCTATLRDSFDVVPANALQCYANK